MAAGWIGDMFWVSQLARPLAERFPGAELEVAGRGVTLELWPECVRVRHRVESVIADRRREQLRPGALARDAWTLRGRGYDLVIDFVGNRYSAAFTALVRGQAPALGHSGGELGGLYTVRSDVEPEGQHQAWRPYWVLAPLLDPPAELPLPHAPPAADDAELERVRRELELEPGRPLALLGPGAGWPGKRWPAIRYRQLARALSADGLQVLAIGSPAERALLLDVVSQAEGGRIGPGLGWRAFPAWPATPGSASPTTRRWPTWRRPARCRPWRCSARPTRG